MLPKMGRGCVAAKRGFPFTALLLGGYLWLDGAVAWGKGADCATKIDINHATAEQLRCLKGVGKKRAAAIVAFREAHGPFPGPAALGAVLSPKIVERLRAQMVVNPVPD
ncbi:MAG: ComEA family DNA-binding protein [Acidithiobacillus sp.]